MRYLNIILILCIISIQPLMLCGCTSQQNNSKIKITHKSRVPKSLRSNNGNVIDLSDGKQVNFGGNLGPQDPGGPRFDVINIDKR